MPSEYGSYDLEALTALHADAGLTPTAYNAAAADLWVFTARNAMLVGGFGLEVTTAYADGGTDQIASLDFRPTHNSDTGRVEKATMTMNNAIVADGRSCAGSASPSWSFRASRSSSSRSRLGRPAPAQGLLPVRRPVHSRAWRQLPEHH